MSWLITVLACIRIGRVQKAPCREHVMLCTRRACSKPGGRRIGQQQAKTGETTMRGCAVYSTEHPRPTTCSAGAHRWLHDDGGRHNSRWRDHNRRRRRRHYDRDRRGWDHNWDRCDCHRRRRWRNHDRHRRRCNHNRDRRGCDHNWDRRGCDHHGGRRRCDHIWNRRWGWDGDGLRGSCRRRDTRRRGCASARVGSTTGRCCRHGRDARRDIRRVGLPAWSGIGDEDVKKTSAGHVVFAPFLLRAQRRVRLAALCRALHAHDDVEP